MRQKSRNFKIGFKRFQRFQRFQRFNRFPSGVGRWEEGRGGRNLEKSRPPTDPTPPFRKLMKLRKFTSRFRFRTFRTTLFLQRLAEMLQHFCNSLVIYAWLKGAQIATADVISAKKGRICASKRDFDAPWDSEKLVGRPK